MIQASSRLVLSFRFHQRRTLLQALFHQLLPLTPIISWPGSIVQHHIFETRTLHFRIVTFYISTLHRLLNRNTINHGLTLLSARLLIYKPLKLFVPPLYINVASVIKPQHNKPRPSTFWALDFSSISRFNLFFYSLDFTVASVTKPQHNKPRSKTFWRGFNL